MQYTGSDNGSSKGGGFCYSDEEYDTMLMDAKILLEHGADGIAFGFLTEEKCLMRSARGK